MSATTALPKHASISADSSTTACRTVWQQLSVLVAIAVLASTCAFPLSTDAALATLQVQYPVDYVGHPAYWLATHHALPRGNSSVDMAMSRSQDGEEAYFLEHFYNSTSGGGMFLEIGGNDGLTYTNTLVLERLGWRGLMIEADPDQYLKMVQNRPHALNIHAAVCDEHRTVEWWTNPDAGLSVVNGIREFMPKDFVDRFYVNGPQKRSQIQCLPLSLLFDMVNVNRVDFASVDVEGAEVQLLRSVNFRKVFIGVLVVETNGHADDIRQLLAGSGMIEHGMVERNIWFVNQQLLPQSA